MTQFVITLFLIAVVADLHWMGMNPEEITSIKQTWDSVKHNEVDILYNIFKAYPDIQARFPQFVGKDINMLKETAAFALHAGRIVGVFSEYITLLGMTNTQPAIKTILNHLGHTHKNRGISKEYFDKFRTAMMGYLSQYGEEYNPQYWNDAFEKMYNIVFSALNGHPIL